MKCSASVLSSAYYLHDKKVGNEFFFFHIALYLLFLQWIKQATYSRHQSLQPDEPGITKGLAK
jgi:hypothetical protein